MGHRRRLRHEAVGAYGGELGVRAHTGAGHPDDLVAHRDALDARADGLDDTGVDDAEHATPGAVPTEGEATGHREARREAATADAGVTGADGRRRPLVLYGIEAAYDAEVTRRS